MGKADHKHINNQLYYLLKYTNYYEKNKARSWDNFKFSNSVIKEKMTFD